MGINWLQWTGLFVAYVILDFLNTRNVTTIQQLKSIQSANLSVGTTIIATLGTYVCVTDSLWNLVPISLGVWVGSYVAVAWEIKLKNGKNTRIY